MKWAHFYIAGPGMAKTEKLPTYYSGVTGFGTQTILNQEAARVDLIVTSLYYCDLSWMLASIANIDLFGFKMTALEILQPHKSKKFVAIKDSIRSQSL